MSTRGALGASSRPSPSTRRRRTPREMSAAWTAVAVCLLAGMVPLAHAIQVTECSLPVSGVFVSISSDLESVDNENLRCLVINWFGIVAQKEDYLDLVHAGTEEVLTRLTMNELNETDGWFRSNVTWHGSLIPDNLDDTTESCLPYMAKYVRNNNVLYSSCLMLRPHWMQLQKTDLWNTRLTKVVIPGTHDAGATTRFNSTAAENVVGRWAFTQDESLWQQLVIGARYLDMRISYYNKTEEKFYVNHGEIVIAPLQKYIDDVVNFMNQTEEIVIFDIHDLVHGIYGYPERHQELIALLESSFGQWMAPRDLGPNPTMSELWNNGKRLIVTYPSSESSTSQFLWDPVYHLWGNANNLEDLEGYLYTGIPQQMNRGSLWSAMAQLTPSAMDVVLNKWNGLRGAAMLTNYPVTSWLRVDWWDQVNIIAMDFLPFSDVVYVAVEANKLRKLCPESKTSVSPHAKRWSSTFNNVAAKNSKTSVEDSMVCADLVGAGGVGIRVWPTLKASPERHSNTMHFRLLQVNWEAERLMEGDWVGVFGDDPRPPHLRPLPTPMPPTSNRDWRAPQPLFWDTPFATHGTITSNYSQPRIELSVLARGGCVGPYVGFVRNGVCVAAECLASHPTWLYDHRAVLGSRSLRSLVLAGTHNAGSYSLADDNDVVASWVACQDEDIISQLLYGIRYLDLRVGYYPDTPELLWVNHDLVRWRPLQEVLDGVRGFLALSPDPLIIDIHRTPVGFKLSESLELLLSLMNTTLGSHFVHNRHGPHVTLDDLWQMGKRVIFTFIDPTVSDHTPWVWPPMPQAWANAQLLDDLRTFLDAEMNKRFESPRLWAAMAHLTPTLWDLLFRSHVGVRGLTDRVSFSITRWLRQRWGHMANIVASDFFRGNDIINVAIRTNLALSMCRPSDPSRHPYTLRWTTELALRPGSPSTTIPPFVRRMYTGGALWSTTGVRQIHYPFIPVDANISMVFTAIPNRVPSVAPGVTYEDNGDTWREVFHYPADGSPQPPEVSTSRPDSRPISFVTPSPVADESSPRASVDALMVEWDDSDSHDFLDEALSGRARDVASASVSDPSASVEDKIQDRRPPPDEDATRSSISLSEGGTTEASLLQGDDLNRASVFPTFTHILVNAESDYDSLNNTMSISSTTNTTQHQNQPVAVDYVSVIGGGSLTNESLLLNGKIQHDNDSLSLVSNDAIDDYSVSTTNNDKQNNSSSTTITASQSGYSLSSADNAALKNSYLQPTNNNTLNSSNMLVIDDINSTSHSTPEQDDVLVVSPTFRAPLEQEQTDAGRSAGIAVTKVWHSDVASPDPEITDDPSAKDFLVLPRRQLSEHSITQIHASKHLPAQVDTSTVAIHSTLSQVKTQPRSPTGTTKRIQASAPTAPSHPSSLTLGVKPGEKTEAVRPSTPVAVQPGDASLTAQLGVSDLTAT